MSDEQTEFQFSDRVRFQKFVVWTKVDKMPDANTLGPLGKGWPSTWTREKGDYVDTMPNYENVLTD